MAQCYVANMRVISKYEVCSVNYKQNRFQTRCMRYSIRNETENEDMYVDVVLKKVIDDVVADSKLSVQQQRSEMAIATLQLVSTSGFQPRRIRIFI